MDEYEIIRRKLQMGHTLQIKNVELIGVRQVRGGHYFDSGTPPGRWVSEFAICDVRVEMSNGKKYKRSIITTSERGAQAAKRGDMR